MNISQCVSEIKDSRKARGKRYSTSSVMNLILAGLLSNRNTLKAIHRFGISLSTSEKKQFGFTQGRIPCYSNIAIIMRKIDLNSIKDANDDLIDLLGSGKERLMHIDGKTLRNSDSYHNDGKKQILTAFGSELKATHDFVEIKGQDEHGAMAELLSKAELDGKIITGDSAFCHEGNCEAVVENNADFAFTLKGNEKNLYYYTNKAFERAKEKNEVMKTFQEETNLAHGRIERRIIEVIDMPFEYLNGFRHIKQICRISREREMKKQKGIYEKNTALVVTSLSSKYSPEFLLKLNRKHWNCENNLNWVKDVIFEEDRSTISTGFAPIAMSLLRSMAITILNSFSDKITETREMFNNYKSKLLRLFPMWDRDF